MPALLACTGKNRSLRFDFDIVNSKHPSIHAAIQSSCFCCFGIAGPVADELLFVKLGTGETKA